MKDILKLPAGNALAFTINPAILIYPQAQVQDEEGTDEAHELAVPEIANATLAVFASSGLQRFLPFTINEEGFSATFPSDLAPTKYGLRISGTINGQPACFSTPDFIEVVSNAEELHVPDTTLFTYSLNLIEVPLYSDDAEEEIEDEEPSIPSDEPNYGCGCDCDGCNGGERPGDSEFIPSEDTDTPAEPIYHTLTLHTTNAELGMVEGAGTYEEGIAVVVKAIPTQEGAFKVWNDGHNAAERVVIMDKDYDLTAEFEVNTAS